MLLTDDSYGGHVSKQRRTIALYSFLSVTNTNSDAGSGLIDTDPGSACNFLFLNGSGVRKNYTDPDSGRSHAVRIRSLELKYQKQLKIIF